MRYVVTQGETEHVLELSAPQDGPRTFMLDGQEHVVEARLLPHGGVNLIIDGRTYDVDFDRPSSSSDPLDPRVNVRVRGQVFALEVLEERKKQLRNAANRHGKHEGPATILSPMPGKVVKLHKAVGDEVKAGEGVVVVEAMKMENELKSPGAGVVQEIRVKEGQPVDAGTVLMVVG
jgi:biotin carboxyl carrier protein